MLFIYLFIVSLTQNIDKGFSQLVRQFKPTESVTVVVSVQTGVYHETAW
jgi:hypothetical protein